MPPKKGKGKEKKADPNKLTNVDRTFYELTITDLNQKLARLRSHLLTLDDKNFNLVEKLRTLEEDRVDIAAHLERTLSERNDSIRELEERLIEITKVRNQEKYESDEKYKDLDLKYKAMNDQLTSEIKLLTGKLNSLDEFRVQRDMLLSKFDDQELQLKEKDRVAQEIVYTMEQKAVIEKDALKKEVEIKLLQVSEDFTRSSEIRNAGYTRRLIRENIALQKEIDTLVIANIKLQRKMTEQEQSVKELKEHKTAMEDVRRQLVLSAQHKIQIISNLTEQYERMKSKYIEMLRYRVMYENYIKRDVCGRFSKVDMAKKLRNLRLHIEVLKADKNILVAKNRDNELELKRLSTVIREVKHKLIIALQTTKCEMGIATDRDMMTVRDLTKLYDGNRELMLRTKRQELLEELMTVLSGDFETELRRPSVETVAHSEVSVYSPGKIGIHRRPSGGSVLEMLKKKKQQELIIPGADQEPIVQIIPKERDLEKNTIIDVELGSTLYVSSSREDEAAPVEEEHHVEMGEEESSEDDIVEKKEGPSASRRVSKSDDQERRLSEVDQLKRHSEIIQFQKRQSALAAKAPPKPTVQAPPLLKFAGTTEKDTTDKGKEDTSGGGRDDASQEDDYEDEFSVQFFY